jgi:hypothetical protein
MVTGIATTRMSCTARGGGDTKEAPAAGTTGASLLSNRSVAKARRVSQLKGTEAHRRVTFSASPIHVMGRVKSSFVEYVVK